MQILIFEIGLFMFVVCKLLCWPNFREGNVMPSFNHKVIRRFVVALSLAASVWVVLFYSFCLRVYWIIGILPRCKGNRLQAQLENGLHDLLVGYGLIALFSLFVPWLIAYPVAVAKKGITPRLACLLPLGWLPFAFVIFVDPKNLFWDVICD